MSVTYPSSIKNSRMQIVADALAGGSLVIGDGTLSGTTGILGTIALSSPAATVAAGVLTISGVPITAIASANGTASLAELRNSSSTVIVSGLSVGTSSADIILSSTTLSSGGTLSFLSGTITHA